MKLEILNKEYKNIIDSNLLNKIKDINNKIYSIDDRVGKTWVNYPNSYNKDEFDHIIKVSEKIKNENAYLLVIGIGGSYLGAKAGIDMLSKTNKVIFVGISLDCSILLEKLEFLKDKNVYVNVISKSGTTVEILSTLNIVEKFLKDKYKDGYLDRLIITTDLNKGYLRELINDKKLISFSVPDDMGGRFSVLSAVGLLPFAVSNININKILDGSKQAYKDLNNLNNLAIEYALYRYYEFIKNNKQLELVSIFDYKLGSFGYWLQQLYCESEGKNNKGLFVCPLLFSRDLHSVGQFIQQGNKCFIETFLKIEHKEDDLILDSIESNNPIKYLEHKSFNDLNKAAFDGTIKAHQKGDVDICIISIDKLDEYNFGYLVYFFELSCAYSAYLLDVNPFDQPGVEQYKSYMKENLNK